MSSEYKFISDITVRLIQKVGGDEMVVAAARVSTSGEEALKYVEAPAEESLGLIRYLMKHRHGCYDQDTEVLTNEGWKRWPDVSGDELFLTRSLDGKLEYQRSLRVIAKDYEGDMIHIQNQYIDLLVTPDHNMLVKKRLNRHGDYSDWHLMPAESFENTSYRIPLGGGTWDKGNKKEVDMSKAWLLGFFIGDGSLSGKQLNFHLRRSRKIITLRFRAELADLKLGEPGNDKYYIYPDEWLFTMAEKCYLKDGSKCVPREILNEYGPQTLMAVLDGLISSDGSIADDGGITYSTTSDQLADDFQELAVRCGTSAIAHFDIHVGEGHFGTKPLHRLCLFKERNSEARIGWTIADRKRQVVREHYKGKIYCVSVPNKTLYIRRNGKVCWCGNSPFEHSSLTFFVHAPIFVWREWHRHRVQSFNEESGRYKTLDPVFYIPHRDRPMMKVDGWKPGRPKFLRCESDTVYEQLCDSLRDSYEYAYRNYLFNLSLNIDPGLARDCLPVGIYSSCWVTVNPRSLMHFLSLRTHEPDKATFVSYPLYEIEEAARACEEIFKQGWPATYQAWNENGRVAP